MEPISLLHPKYLPESVRMLVLFGSRAKGKTHGHSDWVIGYVGNPLTDWEDLGLFRQVGDGFGIPADWLDWEDLPRCSPVLGCGVAREGSMPTGRNFGF